MPSTRGRRRRLTRRRRVLITGIHVQRELLTGQGKKQLTYVGLIDAGIVMFEIVCIPLKYYARIRRRAANVGNRLGLQLVLELG